MTNQLTEPRAENTLSIEDIQAANATAYGSLVGQLVIQKLASDKQAQALAARIANLEAKVSTLEAENSNLINTVIAREDEIDRILRSGPTADQIASQGDAVIAVARNEKAAQD